MTATSTDTTVKSDPAAILLRVSNNLEEILNRIAALENAKSEPAKVAVPVEAPKAQVPVPVPAVSVVNANGATTLHSDPDLSEVKAYAKSKGQNIMGKVTPNRLAQWRALWDADHGTAVAKVETRAKVAGANPWDNYVKPERPAGEGRISNAVATEILKTDPDYAIAKAQPVSFWQWVSQQGAGARVAKVLPNGVRQAARTGKPNAINAQGQHRMVAAIVGGWAVNHSTQEPKVAGPATWVVACEIIRMVRAAGYAI